MGASADVLIIDDHPLFRDALEVAIGQLKDLSVTTQHSGSLAQAQSHLQNNSFDLILLDLNMSDSQDFEAISKIRGMGGETPVLIISATETPQAFSTARSLGASGFIPKSCSLPEMTLAIQTVLKGQQSFPQSIDSVSSEASDTAKKIASLTPAQQRVMSCLSDGLLNKQIAYEMGISEATVKAHMTAIFRKLGANNRTQALLIFREATRL